MVSFPFLLSIKFSRALRLTGVLLAAGILIGLGGCGTESSPRAVGEVRRVPTFDSTTRWEDDSETSESIDREDEQTAELDYEEEETWDSGYTWAEENDPISFEDCQGNFETGDAEDGCNEYVKENYQGTQTFGDYECTEDCSGHQAGYDWAAEQGIEDPDDCGGNSQSFIEGCEAYASGY